MEKNTDLTIYLALTTIASMNEGTIDKENPAYTHAIKMANKAIDLKDLRYGWTTLVQSHEETDSLLRFIKEKFPESIDFVEPYDFCHGMYRFYRKVRFPNTDKKSLVSKLKESGIDKKYLFFMGTYLEDRYLNENN